MNKIRIAGLFFGLIVFSGCLKKPDVFLVEGKITHAEGRKMYLDELTVTSSRPVDSVKIDKNGKFRLKGISGIPTFYLLRLSENNFITLLVDSLERITVEADAADFARNYSVAGSPGSSLVQELNNRLNNTKHQLDSISSLKTLFKDQPDYSKIREQLDTRYLEIIRDQVDYSTKFVAEHPFSMASVLALYQKFDDENYVVNDVQSLKVAASALHSVYPRSEHVKALYANTIKLMQDERKMKMQEYIRNEGINSPEIVLPDPAGNEIALSSLRGKYVLVHFWSAEDKGSRILNQVLVEAYQQFKNRGFEIYQVSVDKKRLEWISAIDNDKLTWANVGDMQGSTQAVISYNIQTIPYNYLLDKDGAILAQDLKGPALVQALNQFLK